MGKTGQGVKAEVGPAEPPPRPLPAAPPARETRRTSKRRDLAIGRRRTGRSWPTNWVRHRRWSLSSGRNPRSPGTISRQPRGVLTTSLVPCALRSLAPQSLAPQSLAPQSLAPQSLAPQSLAAKSFASRSSRLIAWMMNESTSSLRKSKRQSSFRRRQVEEDTAGPVSEPEPPRGPPSAATSRPRQIRGLARAALRAA